MTVVPLPASPCLRVRLLYTQSDGFDAGSRFYLSYSSGAPSSGNCSSIATQIAAAWATSMCPMFHPEFSLTEVDVLDIATEVGNSGTAAVSDPGTRDGTALPAQSATNVEFDIARRYRGGKPRMFVPPPNTSDMSDAGHFSSTFLGDMNTAIAAAFAAIEAIDVGSVGTLAHVNLSYYKGFTNLANSSGRERAVPTYRSAALLDTVTGYATKALIGSQRRRRNATTF